MLKRLPAWYASRHSERTLKRYHALAMLIDQLGPAFAAMDNERLKTEMQAQRDVFGQDPEAALVPVFAMVREAAGRTLGMRHFHEQLLAGIALFEGKLAEMKTGEGKTLAITLAASLEALGGRGVHVVTANPYLASRDAHSMGPVYELLGLSVGTVVPGLDEAGRRAAYACDITYVVNHEAGFDYLRDNLVPSLERRVQRGLAYAIVDEVDSVLIDDARTPLILSGELPADPSFYATLAAVVADMRAEEDFVRDEKTENAHLTDNGYRKAEDALVARGLMAKGQDLYTPEQTHLLRALGAAVTAHAVFRRDHHYVVRDGALHIVDPSTGRLMVGRRWSDGLHQAAEAKEGLRVLPETVTLATITYQSFFTGYGRLCGLTGTARSSAAEFADVYGLEVVDVPTHRPCIRQDLPDLVFKNRASKYRAVAAAVAARVATGQPVLVGTASVRESERLGEIFAAQGIEHRVLNARQDADEATVIGNAGLPGAVTVATNMAGRGTDIVLGGHPDGTAGWQDRHDKVVAAGGLHVLGTERHSARRVDDQLRGRAGRQGDPGSSQFMVSLDDELLRVFGGEKIHRLLDLVELDADRPLSGVMVDRFVNKAQERVEQRDASARKELLRFDSVLVAQRSAIYGLREDILAERLDAGYILRLLESSVERLLAERAPAEQMPERWQLKELKQQLAGRFGADVPVIRLALGDHADPAGFATEVQAAVRAAYEARRTGAGQALSSAERQVLAETLDRVWTAHLTELDELRTGIHLRAHAQENPVHAFSRDSRRLFERMVAAFEDEAAAALAGGAPPEEVAVAPAKSALRAELDAGRRVAQALDERPVRRNEPCPCGSGRRFKGCHGALTPPAGG